MDSCGCLVRNRNTALNNNNKYYLLLKVNKSGNARERRVSIKTINDRGTFVIVQSKNGVEKEKNKVLLFLLNPMEIEEMNINGVNRKVIIFRRHNEYPLILTSHNDILLDLFEDELNKNINELNRFQYYLNKWYYNGYGEYLGLRKNTVTLLKNGKEVESWD